VNIDCGRGDRDEEELGEGVGPFDLLFERVAGSKGNKCGRELSPAVVRGARVVLRRFCLPSSSVLDLLVGNEVFSLSLHRSTRSETELCRPLLCGRGVCSVVITGLGLYP
jgi:hypothetical protein